MINKNNEILLPTMAIGNCLFSPTSENSHGFSIRDYLLILVLKHATNLIQTVATN